MTESTRIRGGRNVAMKVPPHQFQPTVAAYRKLGIPILSESESCVTFEFGPMHLHVDCVPTQSQAEIWLEFIVPSVEVASEEFSKAAFTRCDAIEQLPEGFAGFWVASPASIVHLVSETE